MKMFALCKLGESRDGRMVSFIHVDLSFWFILFAISVASYLYEILKKKRDGV